MRASPTNILAGASGTPRRASQLGCHLSVQQTPTRLVPQTGH